MTHLRIEQGGTTEYVSTAIITKLYLYAKEIKDYEDDPNNNFSGDSLVSLKGTLSAPIGYRVLKEWLESTFDPDLHIILDDYAIPFEDPNMVTYLNSIEVGSNGMVTEALAAAATVVANSANTTVTKFNELRYFTNITLSRGGLSGASSGYARFYNWTALLEVDISNFISLGHDSSSKYEDTFCNCTALTTVTASDKLADIGCNAFYGCSNLTTISGLDGTITLHSGGCFYNCSSLTSNNFSNVQFKFGPSIGENVFRGCSSLTSITLDSSVTTIPKLCFSECTNLATINGTSNVTTIQGDSTGWGVFKNCKALTSIDLSSCTSIGSCAFLGCSALTTVTGPASGTIGTSAFNGCTNLTTIDLSNITSINGSAFVNCSSLTSVNLSSCTAFGQNVFNGCTSLTSVTLSPNLTEIPNVTSGGSTNGFFRNCSSLLSITLPSSLTYIGTYAFLNCTSLLNVTFPSTLTTIKSNAFNNCNLGPSITIPKSVTSIGTTAFKNNSNLSSITFELGRTESLEIGGSASAFSGFAMNCAKQLTVTLPDVSIILGQGALSPTYSGSGVMTTYIFTSTTVPTVNTTIADNRSDTKARITIYVPDSALNDYKANAGFAYFADCIYPVSEYTPPSNS